MQISTFTRRAMSLIVALTLALPVAGAQATSEQRIPVKKDQQVKVSKGEVALAPEVKRLNELEAEAATLRMRLDAHDAANAARSAAFEKTIADLKDSLRIVNEEIATLRLEIAKANALAAAANASVEQLTQRFDKMPHFGNLFGNSGFYIGLGTGANFTNGTLYDIGYQEGFNVSLPIGWSKAGYPIGFRTELGLQTFEGAMKSQFRNIDPVLYTAQAMLTLNLPLNNAKNNLFYLMGGGGAYFFRRIGEGSALADRLGGDTKNVTKLGLTGGAGLEFHVLGATSLFVQSTFTNVFAEESNAGLGGSKNMRWIPIVAGITLR
jgi:opacity protein-like surface antigen